ncbi:hypothetical protein TrispH2_002985 [Trichoplax sp. H2]|nr:hypothetical protein TrispH2_002985 [Trichoplax sp. H2]|eukprot:RDD45080.1 hypothetical protein TrispH2_002985 [Trichoplax sp. H2]
MATDSKPFGLIIFLVLGLTRGTSLNLNKNSKCKMLEPVTQLRARTICNHVQVTWYPPSNQRYCSFLIHYWIQYVIISRSSKGDPKWSTACNYGNRSTTYACTIPINRKWNDATFKFKIEALANNKLNSISEVYILFSAMKFTPKAPRNCHTDIIYNKQKLLLWCEEHDTCFDGVEHQYIFHINEKFSSDQYRQYKVKKEIMKELTFAEIGCSKDCYGTFIWYIQSEIYGELSSNSSIFSFEIKNAGITALTAATTSSQDITPSIVNTTTVTSSNIVHTTNSISPTGPSVSNNTPAITMNDNNQCPIERTSSTVTNITATIACSRLWINWHPPKIDRTYIKSVAYQIRYLVHTPGFTLVSKFICNITRQTNCSLQLLPKWLGFNITYTIITSFHYHKQAKSPSLIRCSHKSSNISFKPQPLKNCTTIIRYNQEVVDFICFKQATCTISYWYNFYLLENDSTTTPRKFHVKSTTMRISFKQLRFNTVYFWYANSAKANVTSDNTTIQEFNLATLSNTDDEGAGLTTYESTLLPESRCPTTGTPRYASQATLEWQYISSLTLILLIIILIALFLKKNYRNTKSSNENVTSSASHMIERDLPPLPDSISSDIERNSDSTSNHPEPVTYEPIYDGILCLT